MSPRHLIRAIVLLAAFGAPFASGASRDGPEPDRADSPIAGLRAPDVEARRAAAIAIRESDRAVQMSALPAMIDILMGEKDGQVRLAVLDAVTALGPDAEPAVPALAHALRNPYGGRRMEQTHQDYRCALALAAIGEPAVGGLRGLLGERRENVRAEAAMALGRIGPPAGSAVPDLVGLLDAESDRVRREAATALGEIGPAALDPLIVASGHREARVRSAAVGALGSSRDPGPRAREVVLGRARDEAPEVRAAALGAIGRWAPPEEGVEGLLRENLGHADEAVRLAAVNVLSGRPEILPGMVPALDALLTGDDEGVSRHAAFALHLLGPDAAPTLLDALRREGSRPDQVAEALALIGRDISGLLLEAAADPEPRVRRGAALALGRLRPPAPGTVPRLVAGLDDPDSGARRASLAAIGELGPRAAEALPAVRALLRDDSAAIRLEAVAILHRVAPRDERLPAELASVLDGDDDARVQLLAIETLKALGPAGRGSLPAAVARLRGAAPEVRLAAAGLIAAHGPAAAEAVPALGEMLGDPDPGLRAVAARTLAGLGGAARPASDRLVPLLDDPGPEVRAAAALALGGIDLDADTLRTHLAGALRDEDPGVRDAARRAVQRLGPRGAIFLPDLIASAALEADRRSAERSLRRFERAGPARQSIPELVGLLEHPDETARLLAIRFLGIAGPSSRDAIPALERLRDDPSPEIREQAGAALGQIAPDPSSDTTSSP